MKRFILFALVLALFGGMMIMSPPSTIAAAVSTVYSSTFETIHPAGIQNATLTTNLKNTSLINNASANLKALTAATDLILQKVLTDVTFTTLLIHPAFNTNAANLTENTFIGYASPPNSLDQAILLTAINSEWTTYGALTSTCYDVDIGKLYTAIAPFNLYVETTDQTGAVPPIILSAIAQDHNYPGGVVTNSAITLTLNDGTASPGEAYAMILTEPANMITMTSCGGNCLAYIEPATSFGDSIVDMTTGAGMHSAAG